MSNVWTSLPGNARNGQPGFTSTWVTENYEYGILVRHDWHPIVCQRTRNPIGEWITHDVYDTVIGLIEVTDSHMGISIGVDANGTVWVSGNAHGGPIRQIRSVSPHDVSAWETAPLIEKQAKHFTNLVENGVVENNTSGWSSLIPARYTADRVTHAYGWGSTHGNDTDCRAFRLTRTADTPSTVIGQGLVYSVSNTNGFPATAGVRYGSSLSMRCGTSIGSVRYSLWMIFRSDSGEISRMAAAVFDATDSTLWYRCSIPPTTAPVGTTRIRLEFRAIRNTGNAVAGDTLWADGAMVYQDEDGPADIVYRDGGFNGGYSNTGWSWNGTPYASTSTGPIRANGYAGINESVYDRFQSFSDGTLILSFAQPAYPSDPVGRAWSIWKIEPSDTAFQPLIDGSDGCIMRNTLSYLQQGSTYPILSTGNPSGDDDIADRAYAPGVWIDRNDILHIFCWFRVKTNTSYGELLYLRSTDKGQTFVNINGDPVSMPLTYPDAVAVCGVRASDDVPINTSGLGGVCEVDGRPYVTINRNLVDTGRRLVYWTGTEWALDELTTKYAFNADAVPVSIRGDVWLFGSKIVSGKGTRAVWGVNHTKDTGAILRMGSVGIGTPDGDYQFESGATYEPAPVHAGGLDTNNNYIYVRLIPDDNTPRIVRFGDGIRGIKSEG